MSSVDKYFDQLVDHFTSDTYREEILNAKREFFDQAGIIDEESHYFEARMAQFLDWYIYTRPLSEYHMPPVQLVLNKNLIEMNATDQEAYQDLAKADHSLFEFLKIRGSDVHIYDLFKKKKVVLRNSDLNVGFNPNEIFDVRVIPFNNKLHFAKGFCFHPSEAKKFILKEVKKIRHLENEQHEALMLRLLKMRYKLEQYKHIRLEYIYTNDPNIKI
mgnify:CR=1 FL=1|tara:strand:- start:4715 stop:5362 length:648 start_codon:yes stop_codon:yes gene_type:complete